MAAHHAEAHQRPAVTRDKCGDDRVERPLARANAIGMIRREHESVPAILHGDARAGDDDAAAEAVVVRLNQRDHHAVRIGGGEINRAAALRIS